MIIGIGGVSRSGKSQLAIAIKKLLSNKHNSVILHQDEFANELDIIPKIQDELDWEIPESINFKAYKEAIIKASNECDIVIAEGLMIFYNKEINDLIDKRIFIEIDRKTFEQRKKLDNRWGTIPDWYVNHIWDCYNKYGTVNHIGDHGVYILQGTAKIDMQLIVNYLELEIELP